MVVSPFPRITVVAGKDQEVMKMIKQTLVVLWH
jgi:hypothetical protein